MLKESQILDETNVHQNVIWIRFWQEICNLLFTIVNDNNSDFNDVISYLLTGPTWRQKGYRELVGNLPNELVWIDGEMGEGKDGEKKTKNSYRCIRMPIRPH